MNRHHRSARTPHSRCHTRPALLDFLESRNLLSALLTPHAAPKPAPKPVIDFQIAITKTTAPATLAAGATATASLNVSLINKSNVIGGAAEKATLRLIARPTAGADVPLLTLANQSLAKLAINAGKPFTLSSSLAKLPAGSYHLIASFTDPTDTKPANNAITAAPLIKVTAPAAAPSFLGKLRTAYPLFQTTLNNLAGIQITSTGLFKSSASATPVVGGGYSYSSFHGPIKIPAQLMITGPGGSTVIQLTFNGSAPDSIGNKTITFSKSSAGATGSFKCIANAAAGIPKDVTGWFKLA